MSKEPDHKQACAAKIRYPFVEQGVLSFVKARRLLQRRYLVHRGIKTAYFQEGSGPDLLLLASPFILASTYMATVKELSAHFRVSLIELPGSGKSERLKRPWGFAEHAEHLKGVAQDLGLKQPIVIGHSNSGPTAALMAWRFPEYVRSAVLVDSVGAHPSSGLLRILLGRGIDALLEPVLTLTAAHHLLFNLLNHTKNFFEQLRLCRGSLLLFQGEYAGAAPILLAWGKLDHTMPLECIKRWSEHWPETSCYISPSGSHDWIITRPKEFTRALVEYRAKREKS